MSLIKLKSKEIYIYIYESPLRLNHKSLLMEMFDLKLQESDKTKKDKEKSIRVL